MAIAAAVPRAVPAIAVAPAARVLPPVAVAKIVPADCSADTAPIPTPEEAAALIKLAIVLPAAIPVEVHPRREPMAPRVAVARPSI